MLRLIADIGADLSTDNLKLANISKCFDDSYDLVANGKQDVTDYYNLALFERKRKIDYILFRDVLKYLYISSRVIWDDLTEEFQKKLSYHIVYPTDMTQGELDILYPDIVEQEDNWAIMARLHWIARTNRFQILKERVSFMLTKVEAFYFWNDVKVFKTDYVDADLPNLSLWLTNGSYAPMGIDYTNTGFSSKEIYYTPARKAKAVDILINGNFELK